MRKLISILSIFTFLTLTISVFSALPVLAGSLSVRLEAPKSPTNQKSFKLNFVTLDVENRSVTIDCYYKTPSGSYQLFETKNLVSGGDNGYCQVGDSQISERGTYNFYVVARAGANSQTSNTVSFEYDDVAPGTPQSFSKEGQPDGCSFVIKFKTADDNGETAKVELYRSETPNYNADNSTKIAEQGIGSNQDGQFVTSLPDCSKTYYFAIRAFDGHGNGSDALGETSTTVTTTTTQQGAIPVSGEQSQITNNSTSGQVLGEENPLASPTPNPSPTVEGTSTGLTNTVKKLISNKFIIGAAILGMLLLALAFYLRRNENDKK